MCPLPNAESSSAPRVLLSSFLVFSRAKTYSQIEKNIEEVTCRYRSKITISLITNLTISTCSDVKNSLSTVSLLPLLAGHLTVCLHGYFFLIQSLIAIVLTHHYRPKPLQAFHCHFSFLLFHHNNY